MISFWQRYPLLWIGLHILLGSGAAAGWGFLLIPLALILWVPLFRHWQRLLMGALLFTGSWFGASPYFDKTPLPDNGLEGMLYFSIWQIKPAHTPFGQALCYQGQASGFLTPEAGSVGKVPCQILIKENSKRPLANCDYVIQGQLKKTRKGSYIFKPKRNTTWQVVDHTFSLAEWRFQFKRKIAHFLSQQFGKSPCNALFTSLATGDIDERTLAIEFSRLGLSHILAISGFHFSLFAAFLLFILGLFLPFRLTQFLVLLLMGAYLFFLGPCASAMRACCAISLALTGKITCLRSSGLNALGAGLAIILLFSPPLCENLGFQLSFLCTAALLFLYGPCERFLFVIFPKRHVKSIQKMPLIDQHGALLAALLRKSLALALAVHLVTLPVCLFYFSSFPLLGSLLYNLFFPFLISLSLFLLLIGCLITAIFPPLASILHSLNATYTNFLLHSITYSPLKYTLTLPSIPSAFLALYLPLLLLLSILWHNNPTGSLSSAAKQSLNS